MQPKPLHAQATTNILLKRGYPCCLITTFCCLVGLAAVCATVFHDGAMNPIEGFLSHFDFVLIIIDNYYHNN